MFNNNSSHNLPSSGEMHQSLLLNNGETLIYYANPNPVDSTSQYRDQPSVVSQVDSLQTSLLLPINHPSHSTELSQQFHPVSYHHAQNLPIFHYAPIQRRSSLPHNISAHSHILHSTLGLQHQQAIYQPINGYPYYTDAQAIPLHPEVINSSPISAVFDPAIFHNNQSSQELSYISHSNHPHVPIYQEQTLETVKESPWEDSTLNRDEDKKEPVIKPLNIQPDKGFGPKKRRSRGSKQVKELDKVLTCPRVDCQKTFKRSEHLKRHLNSVHNPIKAYVCNFTDCGKAFSRSDNLNQHVRTHMRKLSLKSDSDIKHLL